MKIFCKDKDLLKYENELFAGEVFGQFILCRGSNATISGSYLSANNVDFIASGVDEGNVIFVSDDVNSWQAVYEVVQCVLAGQIQISVVRTDDNIIPPLGASGLRFCVVSFKPIIYEVSFELARYFGLAPALACAKYDVEKIVDCSALRTAATFGTLARIYAIMPFGQDETKNRRISEKYNYYRSKYNQAKESSCIAIDSAGNGKIDAILHGGEILLKRI